MASPSDNIRSSIPPRPGSGPGTEIDPQLENVLRNLNVNLEDELTRYRRQRHGRVPPPPPPRRAAQRKTIDLISVSASSEPTLGALNPPPTPPPPPPNPFLDKPLEPGTDAFDADMDQFTDMAEMDAAAADLSETVPANAESDDKLDSSALPVPSNDMPADGYLESSEELLKSLEDEQADPASVPEPYSPKRKDNGLLHLAGLVLFLLGGIGAGFAITSPSQFQNLRSQLWPAGDSADTGSPETSQVEEESDATPSEPTADSSEAVPDGYTPPGPDLSTREFKDLDNVKDLVTLDIDTASSPTNSPTGSPAPAPSSTNPGSVAVPPTLPTNPAQSPLPPAPAGQPTDPTAAITTDSPSNDASTGTTPVAAVPSPAPTVATGSNFYVIASYTGDASLSKARELVPDAFVRNFEAGARIQLAAFDNRAQAEDQVAFLTQQGAVVELFGPTNE